jgi:hypothetical protein
MREYKRIYISITENQDIELKNILIKNNSI